MSGFMQKQVTMLQSWWRVDGREGTMYFPVDSFTAEQAAEAYEFPQAIDTVEKILGFGARLSAPGYLDCTDWSVWPSLAEAQADLDDMYGDEDGEGE